MKKKEEIGNKYGMLQVVSEHSTTRNGHTRYTCICECGNTCNVLATHLRQGNTKHCGCKTKNRIGNNNKLWTGVGELSGNYWNALLRGANGYKRKKIELSITKQYAWDLFVKQNGKCALTRIDLKIPKISNTDKSGNASLDRIDSSKGYIEGNVQWVHKDINIMKNKFNQDYFIQMCGKVISNSCEVV